MRLNHLPVKRAAALAFLHTEQSTVRDGCPIFRDGDVAFRRGLIVGKVIGRKPVMIVLAFALCINDRSMSGIGVLGGYEIKAVNRGAGIETSNRDRLPCSARPWQGN